MTYIPLLFAPVLVAVLTMIGAAAPNVYGRHLSDTQRYNDGYSNGSDAAATDSTYSVACDPTGAAMDSIRQPIAMVGLMDTQQLGHCTH
jgi:hypothetical protein